MVAEVKLDQSIGHFGKEIRIMAVHMHNTLAKGIWKPKLEGIWTWCHALCVKHKVDVLMGDVNMSFFNVSQSSASAEP